MFPKIVVERTSANLNMEVKTSILLVDDSPEKLVALESVLADLNQNLVKATSGKEALRMLLHQDFAVILLDVNMPGMDGFETAALIRQRKNSEYTPIIFVTAISTSEALMYKGYAYGAVDYLFTPVIPEVLRSKVTVFVELEKKTQQIRRQAEQLGDLNRSLRQRAAEIEGINKELESFSYTISHDLRAPLRAMQGLSNALIEDYGHCLDSAGQDYARRIASAASRMDALIQDLLEYSRLSRAQLEMKPVNLEALVDDLLTEYQEEIRQRQASITVQRPLPEVMGHATTLMQILNNLISNGMKFVAPGVPPQISIRSEAHNGWVRVWVEDNGIGIAPEHHDRIFRVFERLHVSEVYPGTGIGLAIVHKAVERLGGRIGLESGVGAGTKFWLDLVKAGPAE